MIGSRFNRALDAPLKNIATKIPFSPNAITVFGFLLTLIFSFILTYDLRLGAICLLPVALLDKLDGVVARTRNQSSMFGSFLDSTLDRLSDSAILIGIAINFLSLSNSTGIVLCLTCLSGSLIISYIRAKAESLGVSCQVGLMERPERLILLFIGAVSGLMIYALWLLTVLISITILQRFFTVGKVLYVKDR